MFNMAVFGECLIWQCLVNECFNMAVFGECLIWQCLVNDGSVW